MAKLFRAVIMGPPGSGKGTIAHRIARTFGLEYLSSGHFLRHSVAAKHRFSTDAGAGPGPQPAGAAGPGHHPQRPVLDAGGQAEQPLDASPQRSRLQHGLQPAACAGAAHGSIQPSRFGSRCSADLCDLPQGKDDVTGEPLVQHEDDKPEALMARLRHYKDVAKPVMDLYKSQGILHSFSGTDTDRIWPYISSLLVTKMH
ncbi:unnamed protein product, partial [Tetraodon nigroviridis]